MRILVITLERLGDLVQATPLLQALHARWPEAALDLVVTAGAEPILVGLPGVGEVKTVPEAQIAALNRAVVVGLEAGPMPAEVAAAREALALDGYDRVINLSHRQFGGWLAGQVRAEQLEGGVINAAGEWLTHGDWHVYLLAMMDFRRDNGFNLVDTYRAAAGAPPPAVDAHGYCHRAPELDHPLPDGPLVAINPGSHAAHRQWPPESFAAVADALAAEGIVPVLVGAPADVPVCERVATACSTAPANLCGRTDIGQMAALLARAALLVSNDTGAVHMAAAVGTVVVGIYGATWYRELAPWGEGHLVLQAPLDLEQPDWQTISPPVVLAAVRQRLGRLSRGELGAVLDAAGTEAWESFMLPPQADAAGGLAYRPLHRHSLSPSALFAWLMRHAFAGAFAGSPARPEIGYLRDLLAEGRLQVEPLGEAAREALRRRVGESAGRLEALEALAEEGAALCRLSAPDGARIGEIGGRLEAGVAALDDLRAAAPELLPAVAFLQWSLRMMPALDLIGLFERYRTELARCAGIVTTTHALFEEVQGWR